MNSIQTDSSRFGRSIIHLIRIVKSTCTGLDIVSNRKHFSNTNLSDLSIVGTCDIFVYRMHHQIMLSI